MVKQHLPAALLAFAVLATAAGEALIAPPDLVKLLAAGKSQPAVLYVGSNVLYRSKHIPAAQFAGPGSTPQGIALLKQAVAKLPKDREIVIYCGCCPWDHCPNIKPALEALRQMGYTHVKALDLPLNFKTNWIDRGYPVTE